LLVNLSVLLDRKITIDDVNVAFADSAAAGPLVGRLRYTTEPVVSSDVIGDPGTCIFHSAFTQAAGRFAKDFGWTDNEWGYTADETRRGCFAAAPER